MSKAGLLFRGFQNPLPVLIFLLLFTGGLLGQETKPALTQKIIKSLTDSLSSQLARYYVDKEAAVKMGAAIRKNFKTGRYKGISDVHILAGKLTEDLRAVHSDEHLHVEYNPDIAYELSGEVEDVPAMVAKKHQREKQQNFGFKKAEVLSGNVAYLELSKFSRLNRYSGSTADAALSMLSNAGALIIDLRYGVGGSPEMMTHILSHFYKDTLHISDIYLRSENTTLSFFTTPDPKYGRLTEIPLYVLTSYKTFSAAEGFVYVLKNTGRAKIIGEITRGGAHTVTYRPLSNGFICDIPFGKAIDPVSGGNWEKSGITPHIAVPAQEALNTACVLALEDLITNSTDTLEKKWYRWHLDLVKEQLKPEPVDSSSLKALAGKYGPYCVSYKEGCLYYQKTGMARFPLLPITARSMRVKGNDSFMIRFEMSESGKPVRLSTMYDDGRIEFADRAE